VKAFPPWVTYTVLRLLLFVVPLAIMLVFGVYWVISVVAAAIIGLTLSYILLRRPRDAVARDLHDIRNRPRPVSSSYDDDIEDAEIDAADSASEGVRAAEHDRERQAGEAGQL
jgi:hypothetical protein